MDATASICAVCRCLREYIPVLKRSLECFLCQTVFNPTNSPSSTSSPNSAISESTPQMTTTTRKRRKKKKRFRLTMPPHDGTHGDLDRLFMPSPSSSSLTSINNDRTAEYTPDTPESTNSSKEQQSPAERDYNDNGSKLNGNKCDGCHAIRYGNWVQCSSCTSWRCYRCVPNIEELSHEEAVFNCEECSHPLPGKMRKPS